VGSRFLWVDRYVANGISSSNLLNNMALFSLIVGPRIQTPQGSTLIPVNVEDVNGYVDLARNEFGLAGEEAKRLMKSLILLSAPFVGHKR